MREIKYIKQPTEYLCGQACVAMIANVSVDDVIQVMHNDKGTGKKDIAKALEHYGITQAKTMTKADIVNEISRSTGLEKAAVLATVEKFMEVVKDSMANGNNVYLRGFGSFIIKNRKEKTARNISRNTTIKIPAHKVPAFKPSKVFLEDVK